MPIRKKTNKNPPVMSHEFIIQNHADIVSCVAMVFLLGLMFEITSKFAVIFITVQYNVTISANEGPDETAVNYFHHGIKDLATVFFYMLVAIIMHAIIQEYVLDKINKKKHFSKTKHSKFNESGQLSAFYLFSFGWGASILLSEDIPRQLVYIFLYLVHIAGAYILNLNRLGLVLLVLHYFIELLFHVSRLIYFSNENRQFGFTIWAVLFVLGRLLTLSLSVLTVGFGLATAENQGFDLAAGNFNIVFVRITVLAAICLSQVFMMWKFINFQLRRWREHSQVQTLKKKPAPAKSKSKKDKANGVNGVNSHAADSPRARKEKSS
ncbi:Translocating chain-associated membrane protein 1 [Takifugu flavidus]|uniref:Translocating chain-associated membrane protein 1 n=1 Tax=Takifugu flavidus TaxID=433684 RepID=A0A5C6NWR2_9TELE|nr:Translocating chain-associated membrane protein 1 [Takifugu flavidus]